MSPGPPPPPPSADGGTVYGGDAGGTADNGGGGRHGGGGGGTVYQGPPPAGSAPLAGFGSPAFHGADFTAGKVLGETFSVYFANFVPFVLLSLLISLPLFVGGAYLSSNEPTPQMAALLILAALPLFLVVSQVVTAGVTYGVYQQMRGQSPSVVDCLRVGISCFLPVLGVAICSGLAIVAGTLACIIPGIMAGVFFSVAVPATVEERPGVFEALRRSAQLTEGYRWHVFGVLFVLGLIQRVLMQAATVAVKDVSSLLMVLGVVIVLTSGLMATGSAVMYYRLRGLKESIDVDQISSVFA